MYRSLEHDPDVPHNRKLSDVFAGTAQSLSSETKSKLKINYESPWRIRNVWSHQYVQILTSTRYEKGILYYSSKLLIRHIVLNVCLKIFLNHPELQRIRYLVI